MRRSLLLLAVLVAVPGTAARGQDLAQRFSQAKALARQGQKLEALAVVREVLAAGPSGGLLKKSRVFLCSLRGQEAEAITEPPVASPAIREAAPPGPATSPLPAVAPQQTGDQISPPEKLFAPLPRYPRSELQKRIQGVVIAEVVIDKEGCLTEAKVLKGLSPVLNHEALRVMKTWVFEPAKLEGVPVTVYYTLTVNFSLQ